MLQVENLSTGYGKKQVLFNISLSIYPGDITLLIGSNGSGKSTLLKAVFGLLPVWRDSRIIFQGEDITRKPTKFLLKSGLLYLPQKNNLFDDLTVRENLEIAGLIIAQKKIRHQHMERSLSLFPSLVPHLSRTPLQLSGGERQLLTFAMAELHQPRMILCDEPLTGLSPQNSSFVLENLRKLNQQAGITILLVEHQIKECLPIADKIIGLKLGKLFSEYTVNHNFDSSVLNPLFI